MTNTDLRTALDAAAARRKAEYQEMTTIMPDRPARRLPPKSRRHSVRHRGLR